jgi:lysophospholipase
MTSQPVAAGPALAESYFASTDGLQLYMASIVPPSPKAAVLVLHGYADHALRYRHVMEAFAAAGYAAYGLDYRGHGRAAGRRGYVEHYEDYLGDARTATARIQAAHGSLPLFYVCHSHGALVGCTLLSRSDAPRVRGVVLSSPYFRLKIVPTFFDLALAKLTGDVPGLRKFVSIPNPLKVEQLTRDEEMKRWTDGDKLRHHVVTPRWFNQSNAAQAALFKGAPAFQWPLLVMQGEDDPVADPTGARDFVAAAGSPDKRFSLYAGMLHEIFNEVERHRPIAEAVEWMDQRLASAS